MVSLFAVSEAIMIGIDIERNTRLTRNYSKMMSEKIEGNKQYVP
jgi:hypothetical protein